MNKLISYFSLSRAERNGFFVIVILIILIVIIPKTYHNSIQKKELTYSLVNLPIENRYSANEYDNTKSYNKHYSNNESNKSKIIKYFAFNPNNLADSLWLELGLSNKQIAVIKNFESKGGRFYKKEDLAKIYSITANDYERLAPYIVIENKVKNTESTFVKSDFKDPSIIIDLNLADTATLKKLNGIGSGYAKRIVNYRNSLGGFYSLNQLKEVYGMDEELFNKIAHQIKLEAININKININEVDITVLKKHPYISNKEAQLIVNYKKQHGDYKSINDLKKIVALNEVFFSKIEPYLSF